MLVPSREHDAPSLAESRGVTMLARSMGMAVDHRVRGARLEGSDDRGFAHVHDVARGGAGVRPAAGSRRIGELLTRLEG